MTFNEIYLKKMKINGRNCEVFLKTFLLIKSNFSLSKIGKVVHCHFLTSKFIKLTPKEDQCATVLTNLIIVNVLGNTRSMGLYLFTGILVALLFPNNLLIKLFSYSFHLQKNKNK